MFSLLCGVEFVYCNSMSLIKKMVFYSLVHLWRKYLHFRFIKFITNVTMLHLTRVLSRVCLVRLRALYQHTDSTLSHTFLIDNHMRLHSSQNSSYTGDVCDMHLRLTAKPHLCVISSTFHT